MALKATIYKAELSIADMDRNYYETHQLTLARHPSETDERMMVRLLAFAIHANDALTFTKGLFDVEEPDLWHKDLTGAIELSIEVGQPDEKVILKACGRSSTSRLQLCGHQPYLVEGPGQQGGALQEPDRGRSACRRYRTAGQDGAAHHAAAMHDPGRPDLADRWHHHGGNRARSSEVRTLIYNGRMKISCSP
jgi:hypothetical protein